MRDDVDQTLTDLDFITSHWTDLLEARHPGTPRPWRQALIDPEQRAAQAARDLEERQNRDPDAPGFTSAPQHVDVLDVIVDTWIAIDELVAAISPDWRRTHHGRALDRAAAEHGPARVSDITPMVEFIHDWLPRLDHTPPAAARAGRRLTRLGTEITRVLGLVRAGQLLSGALCPWCRGCTPKHPAGGAVTMRIEMLPGSQRLNVDPVPAVVCWNPLCTPPEADCGTWYRGRPAWPQHDWDWLAKRLLITTPANRTLLAQTLTGDDVVPIVHSGRSGVDQAIAIVPPRPPRRRAVNDQRGERIVFVGGPFHGQARRFLHVDDALAVTATDTTRPTLAAVGAADTIGSYLLAIVNDRASYVWTREAVQESRPPAVRASAIASMVDRGNASVVPTFAAGSDPSAAIC